MSDLTELPFDPVAVLSRDLRRAAITLSDTEARFLVDAYYAMQDQRIRANNQIRSMQRASVATAENPNPAPIEPHEILSWLATQSDRLENQVKAALDSYTIGHPAGEWLRSVKGIGPVIAAGLLAHIDITQAPTVGHIWRFAGLDPTSIWEKSQRRPWNASLKVICWKAGESFVKVSGDPGAAYGRLYKERREIETAKNERYEFSAQAHKILTTKRISPDTDAYKAYSIGKLPPAHIHARAKRWAVKIFLSHLHAEMCRKILNTEPPVPFPVAILGHAHIIKP